MLQERSAFGLCSVDVAVCVTSPLGSRRRRVCHCIAQHRLDADMVATVVVVEVQRSDG